MRYLIDQSALEPNETFSVYRALLAWAMAKADRFIMSLQHDIYDEPGDEERLRQLGESETIDSRVEEGFLARKISRLFHRPGIVVRVTGTPGEEFFKELTRKGAPARAVAGDVSPAEDFELFLGDRLMLGCYDYGRDLLLDLTEEEKQELSTQLEQAGVDSKIVQAVPER